MAKKKSKWWSATDIRKIKAIMKIAEDEGLGRTVGLVRAADHFGVTRNAISIKLGRIQRGEKSSHLNKPTTKIPITRKAVQKPMVRKSKIEETTSVSTGNTISLDIKDVKLDLKNGKIVIVY
jgi:hypothetical protein